MAPFASDAAMARNPLALPVDLGQGVIGEIRRPLKGGVFLEVQRGAGTKGDRSGQVIARRDERLATAEHGAAIDGLLEGSCVFGGTVTESAELADIESKGGPGGRTGLLAAHLSRDREEGHGTKEGTPIQRVKGHCCRAW